VDNKSTVSASMQHYYPANPPQPYQLPPSQQFIEQNQGIAHEKSQTQREMVIFLSTILVVLSIFLRNATEALASSCTMFTVNLMQEIAGTSVTVFEGSLYTL